MNGVKTFKDILKDQKIVASSRRMTDFPEILNRKHLRIIFVLNCNLFELKKITDEAKKKEKTVFAHIDLVEGLGKDAVGVRLLARTIGVDGIISTKPGLIKAGKEQGLITIQRFFMVDSEAVKTAIQISKQYKPDALEILPAFLPKYYLDIVLKQVGRPVLAGGLILTADDVKNALDKGFQAVTTSRRALWDIDYNQKELKI